MNQINTLNLSHSEGKGVNENDTRSIISVSMLGAGFEYTPNDLKIAITRIGPINFR